MIRFSRMVRSLTALILGASATACVSYPVYDAQPAPSTTYTVVDPWACDPYYGPCAPRYSYPSVYWTRIYYGYPYYGYPYYGYPYYGYPYRGYPRHDPPRHDPPRHDPPRHDPPRERPGEGADWIRNWPPRDRPADPPGNKPGIVYAPKPPRLIPDDRKIPRDPGPRAQGSPGRVIPTGESAGASSPPPRTADRPRGDREAPRVERGSVRPQGSEADPAAGAPQTPAKPQAPQSRRTRDNRRAE
ncbi:hypothetical protein AAG565_09530 [Fontimonas sp. SYSU GA230001]|uniref:hypothetical protein n=1 Tax=Fontimonas sp. SYSU GA230001 TaxID=3142450 RepID=UPI0032B33C12